jgi:hypothetical protein
VDRRPIDPPPILQLRVFSQNDGSELRQFSLSPYFVMHASLLHPEKEECVHMFKDGKERTTNGCTVSGMHRLRDDQGIEGSFFVFPDLSVRAEGEWRLHFSLYEMSRYVK